MAKFSPRDVQIIEAVAKGAGIPADVIAGIFYNEGGGRKDGTALAMNPRFIYGMTSKGTRGNRDPQTSLVAKLRGTLAAERGSRGKAAYKKAAKKVFREIYAHSPYWAVRAGAWGYFGVLGIIAMKRYGGVTSTAARKFYAAFKETPHQAGINAAIDWWNDPQNAKKRVHAHNRDWAKITVGYLGGKGTWYAPRMKENAGIYRKERGMTGVDGSSGPAARRIALIGDSNSATMTPLYASHFSGDKVLQTKHAAGAPTNWFLSLLKALEAGDPSLAQQNRNGREIIAQLIDFKPEIVHITAMGGNDTGRTINSADLKKLEKDAKELFGIIKKYNGTVHGPPKSRSGATSSYKKSSFHSSQPNAAEKYAAARAKVGEVLDKAASEVGIPYFNPWAGQLGDINKKGAYKGDGIHMRSGAAQAHFDAAKSMLGGGTSGAGGSSYTSDSYITGVSGTDSETAQKVAAGDEAVAASAEEKRRQAAIDKKFRAAFEKGFTAQFAGGSRDADASRIASSGFEDDIKDLRAKVSSNEDIVDQAFENQDAPTPEELNDKVEDPNLEVDAPGSGGVILKKYLALLKQYQSDFAFDGFYEEVDVYLKDKSEELFPKSGRDYVFGDEHWKAFVVVRDIKDGKQKQAISESYQFLSSLVKEIRSKW